VERRNVMENMDFQNALLASFTDLHVYLLQIKIIVAKLHIVHSVPGCGWRDWPPDVKDSCEYIGPSSLGVEWGCYVSSPN